MNSFTDQQTTYELRMFYGAASAAAAAAAAAIGPVVLGGPSMA